MREDFVPFMEKLVESQNMKNPSLGELWSLFQINQVSKKENQRRNLTSNNFATHISALWNFCKLAKWPRGVRATGQRANKVEVILQVPFPLAKFSQVPFCFAKIVKMHCERLAKPQLKKNNFSSRFLPCKFFTTLRNSPCVILRYFPTDSVRFLFQDILCNYPFSLCNQLKIFLDIIISWKSFVFRFLGYFSEGLQISLYICLRISHFVISIWRARNLWSSKEIPERSLVHSY